MSMGLVMKGLPARFAFRQQQDQEQDQELDRDQAQYELPEMPPLLAVGQPDPEHEKTLQAYIGRRRPLSSHAPLFDICNLERALAAAERTTQVTTDFRFYRLHGPFATSARLLICWFSCRLRTLP